MDPSSPVAWLRPVESSGTKLSCPKLKIEPITRYFLCPLITYFFLHSITFSFKSRDRNDDDDDNNDDDSDNHDNST